MAIKPRADIERTGYRPALGPYYRVTHWQAERKKDKVHLLMDLAGVPDTYMLRFHSPDTLGFLLEELARYRRYVWRPQGGGPDVKPLPPLPPAPGKKRRPPRPKFSESLQPYFHIGAWCPDELAQMPPEQVHLSWEGVLDAPVVFQFKVEEDLITFIAVLAGLRQAVWPKATAPDLSGEPSNEPLKFNGYGRG
ncbi:MAG: hypothetical protein L6R45_10445 [Anaerolineae bacterium]|nr:hypothetical protein [Anaerolineae bacterium]